MSSPTPYSRSTARGSGRPPQPAPPGHPRWLLPAGLLSLLVLVLVGAWLVAPQPEAGRDPEPLESFEATWSLTPDAEGASPPPARPPEARRLAVVLDSSLPLSGFVAPRPELARSSAWTRLCEQADEILVATAAERSLAIDWYRVAERFEPSPSRPVCDSRAQLAGRTSQIDAALLELRQRFESGELEAAVLVTDLVATSDLTGALGALRGLADWARRPSVQRGELHWGLLGARATYWGARPRGCTGRGELGCWYSELRRQFFPLRESAHVPLYALVLGRSAQQVEQVGESLGEQLRSLGSQTEWELLTAASKPRELRSPCTVELAEQAGQAQLALFQQGHGDLSCQAAERVRLRCTWEAPLPLQDTELAASWPVESLRLTPTGLDLVIDCGPLRDKPPAPLTLAITGRGLPSGSLRWDGWSKSTDDAEADLDRTLGLEHALNAARLEIQTLTLTTTVAGRTEP
jgi:hypothetical protein